MKTINICEEVEDGQDMVYVLEEIVKQIEKGNTSGIDPTWSFEDDGDVLISETK